MDQLKGLFISFFSFHFSFHFFFCFSDKRLVERAVEEYLKIFLARNPSSYDDELQSSLGFELKPLTTLLSRWREVSSETRSRSLKIAVKKKKKKLELKMNWKGIEKELKKNWKRIKLKIWIEYLLFGNNFTTRLLFEIHHTLISWLTELLWNQCWINIKLQKQTTIPKSKF